MTTDDWEQRIDEVWRLAAGSLVDDEVIARIDAIAAERGDDDARAVFERAGARDSAGRPDEAVPLYRRSLELGLDDEHRPQAIVQLASSIRNLGDVDEALRLIEAEHRDHPEAPYRDEVAAFLALVLVSAGDARRGASVALTALAPHLRRYTRSVTAYAADLLAADESSSEQGPDASSDASSA
ncbi:tetratricopeptide repeat protein [Agromyces intestinalis]|uniref:Tetratricopeptide repeat protein n=1 Tax=Agromyces intestinalis TaxID=2592652 RepID=A0A5C1YKK2_9MICO|nr:tetratricopeptide repeat protein [Agromyces intestinalis]QEO15820.1 tetratricopeptide repeat protein [Agromyces intestinalis]